MKIYEASCSFRAVEKECKKETLFSKILKHIVYDEEEIINVKAHIFVYDHEDANQIINKVLFESFMRTYAFISDFTKYRYIQENDQIKEISFNEVRAEYVPTQSQWIRYTRLVKHPDFCWDKYVTIEEPIRLKKGDSVHKANINMFHDKHFEGTKSTVTEVKYTLSGKDKKGSDITDTISGESLRYMVIDPVFNDSDEELKFLKGEY